MHGDVDVLVIGGGPTGTALAAILAGQSIDVMVVDAAAGPERESSRATTVHALTLEQLDRLEGAGAEIAAHAARATCSSVWSGTRRITRVHWDRLPSRYAFMANLPQVDTEAIVRARLEAAGAVVSWSTAATNISVEPDRVRVELDGGVGPSEVRARYVVGCDGAHSMVRTHLEVAMDGTTHEERFLLSDADLATDLPLDETHAFVSSSGVIGFIPMPGGGFRLNGTVTADEQLTVETLPELIAKRVQGHRVALGTIRWLAEYRTHSRLAAHYRLGRVFVAGDAAHLVSPVGGQGMNLGIQDAANLGWKLARVVQGRAPEALLDTYEAERRPVAGQALRLSEINTKMFTARRDLERVVRNNVMRIGHRLPPVQAKLALGPAGLDQHYETGAIASRSRATLVGRRLPDITVQASRRLHEMLPLGEDTLLLLDPRRTGSALTDQARRRSVSVRRVTTRDQPADDETIADPAGRVRNLIDSDAILVRPDGVVGWSGTAPDDLGRYLDSIWSPQYHLPGRAGLADHPV